MHIRYMLMAFLMLQLFPGRAQDSILQPKTIGTGTLVGITLPLRDIPPISQAEYEIMEAKAEAKRFNPKLRTREYPFAETALPKGPDGVWQNSPGTNRAALSEPIVNFQGQTSPYNPPDENGVAGPNHYMQTVNTTYAIYSKTGALLAGPTNMNLLFGSVAGSNCNDGDPIILYDEMAGRWLAAEFSLCGSPDRMLIAVSATDDPTGVWYQYSFNMGGMPDYEKFGIWPDGYYMGTNTNGNTDIYVFEREVMLAGGASPKMVAFDNAWRPGSVDGFMMVPPVDNDGPAAPAGTPGIFIAHQDDAFGGTADQLWIYELDVDWTTTSNSTFTRVQQINVEAFDSNFGNNWNNIKQPGTTRELDAIPQVIMNVPQYRNFGTYQTIVCCHTVDVDASDHAGVRWYELRKTTGSWTIRQQGTYAPDEHSRWMASIAINGSNEIGLGYSISSNTVYPGIRYAGQSSTAYAQGNGLMDISEGVIWEGTASQTSTNRWGDYSLLSVDPSDDKTFWYTNQYTSSGQRTRVASFMFSDPFPLPAFTANNYLPCLNETVSFTGQSTGSPTGWEWTFSPNTVTFVNGTSSTSQNPSVKFNALGVYDVTLSVTNPVGTNAVTESGYIVVNEANAAFSAFPRTVNADNPVVFTDESTCDLTSWSWNFGEGAMPATATGAGPHTVIYSSAGTKTISLTVNGGNTMTRTDYITVLPNVFNMGNSTVSTCSGTFHDFGGSSQNYSNNLNQTMVIQSNTSGLQLQVEFTEFLLQESENCVNDFLKIYNGTSSSAPLMGTWCGSDSPGTVVSDNVNGALTFVFGSNNTITAPGWSANLSCVSPVNNPSTFTAEATSESEIQLNWSKNAENSDVLVAWSNGLVGQPVSGVTYTAGDVLPGGGTVIYSGTLLQYSHTGLQASTVYNYRAFSFTPAYNYSSGLPASATTLTPPPTLAVSPGNINVSSAAGSTDFTVTSNSSWTAQTTSGWCTVTPSGNGNGQINVVYEANSGVNQRIAQITVTVSGMSPVVVTLTQSGIAPVLVVSPLSFNVPAESGSVQATVTSNSSWTAQTTSGWCTVTPSGNGNGQINVVYEANSGVNQRIAQITVTVSGLSPVTVTLTQAGATPVLAVSPISFVVPAASGSVQATVTSNTQWTASSNQPGWCTVTPSGSGNGIITITYAENLRALVRNAIITLSAVNVSPVTISVSQEAAQAYLSLDPTVIEVSNESGSAQVAVTSNFNWTAQADASWCIVTPAAGIDNATLTLSYTENISIDERSVTINVQGNSLSAFATLVQAGALAVLNVDPLSAEVSYESGSFEFIITSNIPWNAAADATWLEVTPSGIGSGILKVMYDQNPSAEERLSTISLTGEGVATQSLPFLQLGTGVGISEYDPESLRIYPNPANEAITIEVNPAELNNFKAQLIAPSGTVIMEKSCSGKTKYGMDISAVKSGSYVVRLVSGEKMINRILVIIK
ncbi:MAG: BACON domain-containing carbohydrate-binding protein [Lentimicrobium sp.]|nr:BACON domain-containing carbohydrate-binding protein [Lentimicrobium sp.]